MGIEERIEKAKMASRVKKFKKAWYKKWWGIIILIIAFLILIYLISFAYLMIRIRTSESFRNDFLLSRENKDLESIEREAALREVKMASITGLNSPFLGNPDADIVITVFSDFYCPFCRESSETIIALNAIYGDDVKIIIRDFPIMNDDSELLAVAALCAHDQNMYFEMYKSLFSVQDDFDLKNIGELAQRIGIPDLEKYYNCLITGKDKEIERVYRDASFLELSSTPTWFIDDTKVNEGHIPFKAFDSFFKDYLKQYDRD
jgi:protein-disulfide isomerase